MTPAITWRKRQLSPSPSFYGFHHQKGSKKSKAKPRHPVVKKSQPKQAQNIQSLQRALDESLAREAAASEILRMIASSPTELQPVLDAIAERAARLCDASDAVVWRVRRRSPTPRRSLWSNSHGICPGQEGVISDRGTPVGRAIIDRQTIHVDDLQAAAAEFPGEPCESHRVFAQCSWHHYCVTGCPPSALFKFADERSGRSQISKSNCLKPLRTKR